MRMKNQRFWGILLSLVLVLGMMPGMSLAAFAEDGGTIECTINDGTTENNRVPVCGYYCDNYQKSQFVITEEQIMALNGKELQSMRFYLSSPAGGSWGNARFQVFIGAYDNSTIDSYQDISGHTMVYEGSLDGTGSYMDVSFSNATYTYSGGNLLVTFHQTDKGAYYAVTFYGVGTTEYNNASISGYDSRSLDAVTSFTKQNFTPKVTFTYTPHKHGDITFGAWTRSDGLPSSDGSYYLTQDVELNDVWEVPAGTINLCLNGHKITQNNSIITNVINIMDQATLNLYDEAANDGEITHASGKDGGGVCVLNGGQFNMYGGKITGNYTSHGGGVYVYENGIFNMNGGIITGNTASYLGGGVCSFGEFTMSSGSIRGNTTTSDNNGGGVFNKGTFTMSGGSITGNTAKKDGGGVLNSGTFTMSGGSITGNTATRDGGGVRNEGAFKLSGAPTISCNTQSDGVANNVYLSHDLAGKYDYIITINGNLTNDTAIGVTMESPGVFTSGWNTYMSGKGPGAYFTSENAGCHVFVTGDELMLSPHNHDFSFVASGNTITATCNAEDGPPGCPLPDKKATLTLNANDATYSGSAYTGASLATQQWVVAELDVPTIEYEGRGDTTYEKSTTAPTNAGTYTASITYDSNKTASKDFTIAKAAGPAAPTETFVTSNASGADQADGKISGFDISKSYQISSDGGSTWADVEAGIASIDVKPGTYLIRYPADTNHEAGASVSVKVDYTPSGGGGGGGGGSVTDPVQQVVDMINALPVPVSEKDADAVEAARDAYDKLTDEQKKDSRFTDEVMKKLTDAEAVIEAEKQKAADQAAAKAFDDVIAGLPADESTWTREQLNAALAAYNALTDAQKALVDPAALAKLQNAEFIFASADARAKKAKIKSVKAKKGRKAQVKWTKNTKVTGYQLVYSTSRKFTKKTTKKAAIKSNKTVKKTVGKLKKGKTYYFRVRPYTKVYNGVTQSNVTVYGKWSGVKKCKAKN